MFLGHAEDDGSAWSHRDRELAKALLMYEGSLCSGCRQPAHESRDPDRLGWYNVEPVVCTACHALAKADVENEPGTYLHVSLDPNYVKRS